MGSELTFCRQDKTVAPVEMTLLAGSKKRACEAQKEDPILSRPIPLGAAKGWGLRLLQVCWSI